MRTGRSSVGNVRLCLHLGTRETHMLGPSAHHIRQHGSHHLNEISDVLWTESGGTAVGRAVRILDRASLTMCPRPYSEGAESALSVHYRSIYRGADGDILRYAFVRHSCCSLEAWSAKTHPHPHSHRHSAFLIGRVNVARGTKRLITAVALCGSRFRQQHCIALGRGKALAMQESAAAGSSTANTCRANHWF